MSGGSEPEPALLIGVKSVDCLLSHANPLVQTLRVRCIGCAARVCACSLSAFSLVMRVESCPAGQEGGLEPEPKHQATGMEGFDNV